MDYLWLKWIHILSSTLLFGTGLGSAFYMYFASRTHDARVVAGMRVLILGAGTSGLVVAHELVKLGYDVTESPNGRNALHKLQQGNFDLAFEFDRTQSLGR